MGPRSKSTRNTGKADGGKIKIVMGNKNATPGISNKTLSYSTSACITYVT